MAALSSPTARLAQATWELKGGKGKEAVKSRVVLTVAEMLQASVLIAQLGNLLKDGRNLLGKWWWGNGDVL